MTEPDASNEFEPKRSIDKVRASRDGHAYHEAWAARSALELLPPLATLHAIALEGFSVEDSAGLGKVTVEIADVVRYHGASSVDRASRVEVVQFKYSIADADTPIRAADITKTLTKFGSADADFRGKHGDALVDRVVCYDFATNRPIHRNLLAAVMALRTGAATEGEIARQAEQITAAMRSAAIEVGPFLGRLNLSGGRGSLKQADRAVQQTLAAWGEASDPESEKRLLKLRSLIRSKVGSEGEGNNLVDRVAVLAELDVDHESTLYPTPDAFPPIAHVVTRAVVEDVVSTIRADPLPLIVHGAGGMGKTVLMQAVAERLRASAHVITFDGFGAGKWRDPADGRHRPERTLVHLANLLAGQGLCDILLPTSDETGLMRAFRRRLAQSVDTVRQVTDEQGIVLILDAIDHAAIQAATTGTRSFAHLLLKSLSIDPIDGVMVIGSCRTERLSQSVADARHRAIEIPPFTSAETRELILTSDSTALPVEIAALEGRSGRNPRCLDALLKAGRPYDVGGLVDGNVAPSNLLDALLGKRIDDAREAARAKGATDAGIDVLLAGLSLLPPPVPIAELAAACSLTSAEVESFATDLSPLLERTPHGLMFRDEPTETLIRGIVESNRAGRDRIVQQLLERQSHSDYAARALPAVLTALQRVDTLVDLAFDTRVPPGVSKVGQRDIRLARIVAALETCARAGRHDDLVRLLLEAALVAAGHERSDRFLYEHPDLVAVVGDSEALRRLFATKTGWPGGRHAALAIANAFVDDLGEARRNAKRAIDWHNWAVSQRDSRAFEVGRASTQWDDVGFAYVEMLVGNDVRMARWIAQQPEGTAYDKFSALFDLLERHPVRDKSIVARQARLLRRVARCRLPARAFWSAALRYSNGDANRDRGLITRLAAAPVPEKTADFATSSLLAAAARATSLGMRSPARAILKQASNKRPSIHDFSSYWPIDRGAENAVTVAGLTAALRGTAVNLRDIAPRELLDLVPRSIHARGPGAFARDLEKRLSEKVVHRPGKSKRQMPAAPYKDREEYRRVLDHRITPLLPFAEMARRLLSPKSGESIQQLLNQALDRLEQVLESTSNYPYRDGKAYVARIAFSVLFEVADAIGALDRPTATRIVAWLKQAPGLFTPGLTQVVSRLSRSEPLHDAALDLAAHVEGLIRTDTDTASRISAYGELARAVWRVSADEAAAYFRRGLDLADAVGSDDFDRTQYLLALAGHYRGDPLIPSAAHDLARIFELNQSDDSKFPWVAYGKAMATVAGTTSLAMVARLDDRDKAGLGHSLPPLLTELVAARKLSPDLAGCLIGLAQPVESWTWRIGVFVAKALEQLPIELREWLFQLVLVELDRADRLESRRETLQELLLLATEHLPAGSGALHRIQALADRRGPVESGSDKSAEAEQSQTYAAVDLDDADAIDWAIESDVADHAGKRWPRGTLAGLARNALTPSARQAFVVAVASVSGATLSDKLRALERFLGDWTARSVALRERLPQIGVTLAAKHASELVGRSWESDFAWQHLTTLFCADRTALAAQVVASLGAASAEISGDSWLGLAAQLAPSVAPGAVRSGLERFLAHAGPTLPAEVGDGPWHDGYVVGYEQAEVVAGLIWSRLGNYAASSRWRAAHAVRRLAAAGRFDVIDRLVDRFGSENMSPFVDAKLPSYILHARLWLLIALARVAADHPSEVAKHRALLERVAFDAAFPHVPMRGFAAEGLRQALKSVDAAEVAALRARLESVNVSSLPREERAQSDFYAARPKDLPRRGDEFHLDYDFNKYQVTGLANAFGRPGWEVEDGITRWVRQWDSTAHGMYECPRITNQDYNTGSWSSGSPPDVDRYGGYLGWHALMLVGGEMLAAHPVNSHVWREDPWSDFLRDVTLSRTDGLWLSDSTDLVPLDLVTSISMPKADAERINTEDQAMLTPVMRIGAGKTIGESLVVSGNWSLPHNVSVTVRSVLASDTDARATILAALTDRKFSQWLPHDEDDVQRNFRAEHHSVTAWLKPNAHAQRCLDQHDPYAAPTAMSRPTPEEWVSSQASLEPADPIIRCWTSPDGPAFYAEAWGATGGRGDNSWNESGERLAVSTAFLSSILARERKVLVGFVKAQLYVSDTKERIGGDQGAFIHRVMMFTIDRGGRVWIASRISGRARAAVASLASRDRSEFHARFSVLRAVRRPRRK